MFRPLQGHHQERIALKRQTVQQILLKMSHTRTSLTEFIVTICLCKYHTGHDLLEVETRQTNVNGKLLNTGYAVRLNK